MANRLCQALALSLLSVLVAALSLDDAAGVSNPKGTCSADQENDEDLCDSKDENMYLEIIQRPYGKDGDFSAQSKETKDISSYESWVQTTNESFSGRTQNTSNLTTEWLGLKIPFVEGVEVRCNRTCNHTIYAIC